MTKISKRITQVLLAVVLAVCVWLGVALGIPETKTASADTAVTFNSAVIEDGAGDDGFLDFRINTSVLTWDQSANDVAAADWKSVADYTTLNGRTITEWNSASASAEKIRLTLQPAGSFSFLRIHIPTSMEDNHNAIRSVGILDGWSFTIGSNTYTSTAVNFLRTGDTLMLAESLYSTV